jgi:hypothetical protein
MLTGSDLPLTVTAPNGFISYRPLRRDLVASLMMAPDAETTLTQQAPIVEDRFASLDEVAQQEMLSAATDHLGEFSNTELVTLIGF